jgi:hypothetical protein
MTIVLLSLVVSVWGALMFYWGKREGEKKVWWELSQSKKDHP